MHNRGLISRSPASSALETPEKKEAAGIGFGDEFAVPSPCSTVAVDREEEKDRT